MLIICILSFLFSLSTLDMFGNCLSIPKDFIFGASTAAYQIEGGWNEDGKGENIWDYAIHNHRDWVKDNTNADIAADSYHKFEEDIKMLKNMGLKAYRFSISWARILPKGDLTEINQAGIDWYSHFIDRLLEEEIEPIVTLYHWDMPQELQKNLGGMTNPLIADYFEDYANIAFSKFGDRVKWWITFNEPTQMCLGYAYGPVRAPGILNPSIGDYLCGHSLLLSHARIYKLYDSTYRLQQKGKIGISLAVQWYEPKTNTEEDKSATQVWLDFEMGWIANPIFSKEGDYPQSMKNLIAEKSKIDGFRRSRLPEFTSQQIIDIRGSADFIGINHYTSYLISANDSKNPSRERDAGIVYELDPSWPPSSAPWMSTVPWGLRKLVIEIGIRYPGYDIFITENGYPDDGELKDTNRVNYLVSYLEELMKAVNDYKVPVIGYLHWSLMDNFEWMEGYSMKFGLYKVDFEDVNRTRTAKISSQVYADIVSSRQVPPPYFKK